MPATIHENPAETVAIYATLIYGVVAASCSSPQTAEINAEARAGTLMKWVKIGMWQGIGFGVLGMLLDDRRWPPLLGAGLAMGALWAQYKHALKAGLENPGPSTERG